MEQIFRHGLRSRVGRVKQLRLQKEVCSGYDVVLRNDQSMLNVLQSLVKIFQEEVAKRTPNGAIISRAITANDEANARPDFDDPQHQCRVRKFLGAIRALYSVHHDNALEEWDRMTTELESLKLLNEGLRMQLSASKIEHASVKNKLCTELQHSSKLAKEMKDREEMYEKKFVKERRLDVS